GGELVSADGFVRERQRVGRGGIAADLRRAAIEVDARDRIPVRVRRRRLELQGGRGVVVGGGVGEGHRRRVVRRARRDVDRDGVGGRGVAAVVVGFDGT